MAGISVRQLDGDTKSRLRIRAARHGHSVEREAREILEQALRADAPPREHLVDAIRRRMRPVGGETLPVISRGPMPEPAEPMSSPN